MLIKSPYTVQIFLRRAGKHPLFPKHFSLIRSEGFHIDPVRMDEGVRRIVNIPVRQRIFPMRNNAFEEGGGLIDKLASVSDTVELDGYGKQ